MSPNATRPPYSPWARHWTLDASSVFLNHGSFGACPRAVLEAQQGMRDRLERQPVLFLGREIEQLLLDSKRELAAFVGAPARDLAFVPNATAGVNTVLRSLALLGATPLGRTADRSLRERIGLREGDEILITDHEYNACSNAVSYTAACTGARVALVTLPFPLSSPEDVLERILESVTPRTRLLLVDHITSPTGLLLPVRRIVREMEERGIDTLVDGAHAPGMVPLDLESLGAAYFTGNCHKWLCAPKGAALLYVRPDRQRWIRPLSISHGANSTRTDRSLFELEFDWTGTCDPTPYLAVGEAIRCLGSLLPGGWGELMERNHALALEARETLCRALAIPPPCPAEMLGSLLTLPLPDGHAGALEPPLFLDPLQIELWESYGIEVPVIPWPQPPHRWIRASAQLYNHPQQYEYLGQALRALL